MKIQEYPSSSAVRGFGGIGAGDCFLVDVESDRVCVGHGSSPPDRVSAAMISKTLTGEIKSLTLPMKRRTKRIFALMLTLLAGFVVYFACLRKCPSASHQGYYVEKYLRSVSPSVFGGEVTTDETLDAWDKYDLFNPTDRSIWIGAFQSTFSVVEPLYEYRLSPALIPGISDSERSSYPSRFKWQSLYFACGNGRRFHEIEVPAGSTRTILMPSRIGPRASALLARRIPYRTYPSSSRDSRNRYQKIPDFILEKLSLRSISIPPQPIMKNYPDVVDHVVDERFPAYKTTKVTSPDGE